MIFNKKMFEKSANGERFIFDYHSFFYNDNMKQIFILRRCYYCYYSNVLDAKNEIFGPQGYYRRDPWRQSATYGRDVISINAKKRK